MADQPNSSIFQSPDKGTAAPAATTTTSSAAAPDKDSQLAILVGEGRKYKSVEDLAKAYLNLDGFTEKLKTENAEFRDKLAGAKTIEDVLQRLKQPEASAQDKGAANAPRELSADAIAKIVRDTVTGMESAKSQQDNLFKADAAMKKLFGEKAKETFEAQARTPEVKQALMQLAAIDPDKFVKLFSPGDAKASGTQTDSGSTVNSAALADTNQSARAMDAGTREFYNTLRQKEPKKYYSTEVQLAMHKAAQANPEKFFGRKLDA